MHESLDGQRTVRDAQPNDDTNDCVDNEACSKTAPASVGKRLGASSKEQVSMLYARNLMERFADQRNDGSYCDLTIQIEDEAFPVHRCLMAASCDFFDALGRSKFNDSQQNELTLKGISKSGFRTFLDFVYTGVLEISTLNLADLLRIVTHLQCEHAIRLCKTFMVNSLSHSNCIDILTLSEMYSMDVVTRKTLAFIENHFISVFQNDTFVHLSYERLLSFIRSNSLRLFPEICVFHTVRKWIEQDPSSRMHLAGSLMDHVRLLTIPADQFVDQISKCDLMRRDGRCCELLLEAFEYFALPLRRYSCDSYRSRIRNSPVMVCVNENMYIYNNERHKWKLFGSSLNSWKTLSQKFIVVNNYLYACGGYSERNRETTGGCHRFDPQTGSWTNIAPMIEKRQFFTLTANQRMIVAVGGVYGDRGNFYASHPVHSPLEVYHIDHNIWRSVKCEMPVLKWPCACVFQDYVFIVGGKHTEGHNHRISHGSFLVNIKNGQVSVRQSPITPRFNSSMYYVDDKAILFGGEDDKYRLAPCVELYDFSNDRWTEIAQIPVNLSYQYISTSYLTAERKVHYLMEEHDGPTSESYVLKVASFDLDTREFSDSTILPHPQAILASRWCSLVFPQEFFASNPNSDTVMSRDPFPFGFNALNDEESDEEDDISQDFIHHFDVSDNVFDN